MSRRFPRCRSDRIREENPRAHPPGGAREGTERAVNTEVVKLFKGLRVADVRDGLDWIGMPNKGSVDRSIMPIAEGMKFCGPAFTV
jgi:hypothetical protein